MNILLLAICLASSASCRFFTVAEAPDEPIGVPTGTENEIEVVLLVEGQLCLETVGDTCFRMLPRSYYPVDLLNDSPSSVYNETALGFSDAGLNVALCDSSFALSCDNPRYKIKDIGNYQAWLDYGNRSKRNVIEIRVRDPQAETHWSYYLMLGTLGIVPGIEEQRQQIEVVHFDQAGEQTVLNSGSTPYHNVWHGWVFAIWGEIASTVGGGSGAYSIHFRKLIKETESQ